MYHNSVQVDSLVIKSKNNQMPLPMSIMKSICHTNSNHKKKKKKVILRPNKIIQSPEVYQKEFFAKIESLFNQTIITSNNDLMQSARNSIIKEEKVEKRKAIEKAKRTIQIQESNIAFVQVNNRKKSPIVSKRANTQNAKDYINNSINCIDKVIPSPSSSTSSLPSSANPVIKTCITPFDLGCVVFNNIREVQDEIGRTLLYNHVKYKLTKVSSYLFITLYNQQANGIKFTCTKKAISFELEVLKAQSVPNAYAI